MLGWDDDRLAKAAKEGNVAALDFLIDAYTPLVAGVVWKYLVPLKMHRVHPDPYEVIELLGESSLPRIVEKWDPKRSSWGYYAKQWGKRIIRDDLYYWLSETDPAFIFNRTTKILSYPKELQLWPIGDEDLDLFNNESVCSIDGCLGRVRVQKEFKDRLTLASANELAHDELSPEEIRKILDPIDARILWLSAEDKDISDAEIAEDVGVHRTTVGRRRTKSLIDLYKAAHRAKDLRVAEVIAKNLGGPDDEDEPANDNDEEILEMLFLMKYVRTGD